MAARDVSAELDRTSAQLAALIVDLSARARHRKVEGLAMPLLAQAKMLCARLDELSLAGGGAQRFGHQAAQFRSDLDGIERTFAQIRSS